MTRSISDGARPAGAALLLIAAAAGTWLWRGNGPAPASGDAPVRVVHADAAAPLPAAGPAVGEGIALHAVRPGDAPERGRATLSASGSPPRDRGVGDEVAPGVRLAAVFADHVLLDDNGRASRLYLLGGLAGASGRRGLSPEPAGPSGELGADELIARTQARGDPPPERTPEEIAAGR